MYAARYGPFTFLDWKGTPVLAQRVIRMRKQSGKQGRIFEDVGYDVRPFSAMVVADTTTWAMGHILPQNWQDFVGRQPQLLELGGFTYGAPFLLLEVGQPDPKAILAAFGGTTSPLTATAIVTAQLTLIQVVPGV